MAWAVDELSDVHGRKGPGVMIESVTVQPIVTASALPGFGAAHAERMTALPHLAKALVVIHGRTRGTMAADSSITHALLPEDVERLRAGMLGAARCYLAAGAEEVLVPVFGSAPIRREAGSCPRSPACHFGPAISRTSTQVHLFGGAAMGGGPETGVCDARGAVYGVRGTPRRRRGEPSERDRSEPPDHHRRERPSNGGGDLRVEPVVNSPDPRRWHPGSACAIGALGRRVRRGGAAWTCRSGRFEGGLVLIGVRARAAVGVA